MALLMDRIVPQPGLRLSILGFGGTTLGGRHVYADVDEAQAAATVDAACARGRSLFPHGVVLRHRHQRGPARPGASALRSRRLRAEHQGRPPARAAAAGRDQPRGCAVPPGVRLFLRRHAARPRRQPGAAEVRSDRHRLHPDVGNADHFHDAMHGAYRALERLRGEGAIDAIGAGVGQWETCRDFAHAGDFDLLMLACRYTLVEHQLALHELLPLCLEKRIGVAVAAPFNSGILAASPPGPDARFNYGPAGPWLRNRVSRVGAACTRHGVPLAAAALQFPLGHPAVVTVVAGSRSPAEVAANVESMSVPIPPAFWAELKADGLIDPDAPVPVADGRQRNPS